MTQISIAFEVINFGVFTTFMIVQYGLVIVVLGAAMWLSDQYQSYLGRAGLVLGMFGTVMGIIWAFSGLGDVTATLGFGALLTSLVWVVIVGAVMVRTPPEPAGADEALEPARS